MMMRITKPTLLIDEMKAKRNISRMIALTKRNNIRFRPHFKTHQSSIIGKWFIELGGGSKITVSSLDMAEYFANAGWSDITVGIPVNLLQVDQINRLADKIRLNLVVDSLYSIKKLIKMITTPVDIWIEIDINCHRTGVDYKDETKIIELARLVNQGELTQLKGIFTHAGNVYHSKNRQEIIDIHRNSILRMTSIRKRMTEEGFQSIEISVGDTPSCCINEDFTEVNEIRPGTFVFHDLTQVKLGVCSADDIAIAVGCPIIGKYPHRKELVIYGGAIHLSKEYLELNDNRKYFGKCALLIDNHWELFDDSIVMNLSQEHGIIYAKKEFLNKLSIGDIILVIPIHACLTANLFDQAYTLGGNEISTFRY